MWPAPILNCGRQLLVQKGAFINRTHGSKRMSIKPNIVNDIIQVWQLPLIVIFALKLQACKGLVIKAIIRQSQFVWMSFWFCDISFGQEWEYMYNNVYCTHLCYILQTLLSCQWEHNCLSDPKGFWDQSNNLQVVTMWVVSSLTMTFFSPFHLLCFFRSKVWLGFEIKANNL